MEQVPEHLKRVSDLSNMSFGMLLAVKPAGRTTKNQVFWECLCECGKIVIVDSTALRRGHTQSCGCLRLRRLRESITTHGHAAINVRSPTYYTWQTMLQRCENPNSPSHSNYGGRGIKVCERWHSFESFLEDMKERPSVHYSIERRDNNGNYEPGNCYWATRKEQQRNRAANHFVTAFGETLTIAEWAETRNVPYGRICSRLKLGWNPEDAIALAPSRNKYKKRLA